MCILLGVEGMAFIRLPMIFRTLSKMAGIIIFTTGLY